GQERSYHYVEVMIADGKVNIEFMIWTFQDDWEDYMATMLEIADSMEFGELPELKPRFTNRVPRVKVDPEQRALMRRRDKKLAEDWVKKASWFTDYDKAREEAKKADKLIFAYFTRSYED
ncbi:MAG: hypothetical protein HYY16_15980, partial [Planctomycetes bacterium]|nr:hypothetical protein [Planctomycetota bacterium]